MPPDLKFDVWTHEFLQTGGCLTLKHFLGCEVCDGVWVSQSLHHRLLHTFPNGAIAHHVEASLAPTWTKEREIISKHVAEMHIFARPRFLWLFHGIQTKNDVNSTPKETSQAKFLGLTLIDMFCDLLAGKKPFHEPWLWLLRMATAPLALR